MTETEFENKQAEIEKPPPFGKSWPRLYSLVILSHIIIIILFYLITNNVS